MNLRSLSSVEPPAFALVEQPPAFALVEQPPRSLYSSDRLKVLVELF